MISVYKEFLWTNMILITVLKYVAYHHETL